MKIYPLPRTRKAKNSTARQQMCIIFLLCISPSTKSLLCTDRQESFPHKEPQWPWVKAEQIVSLQTPTYPHLFPLSNSRSWSCLISYYAPGFGWRTKRPFLLPCSKTTLWSGDDWSDNPYYRRENQVTEEESHCAGMLLVTYLTEAHLTISFF